MPTIEVTITRGGRVVETTMRPVRALPRGKYGAIFRGRVFAFGPNRTIDIAGKSYDASTCPPLRVIPPELGEAPPATAPPRLYLDRSGKYPYLLLSGTKAEFRRWARLLEGSDVDTLGSGESLRPADNGVQYDWYFRLNKESLRSLQEIAEEHAPGSSAKKPIKPRARPVTADSAVAVGAARLERKYKRAEAAWASERTQLERAKDRVGRKLLLVQKQLGVLQADLDSQRKASRSNNRRAVVAKGKGAREQVEQASAPAGSPNTESRSPADSARISFLEANNKDWEQLVRETEGENSLLKKQLDDAGERIFSLQQQYEELASEVRRDKATARTIETGTDSSEGDSHTSAKSGSSAEARFETFLRATFPKFCFGRDSIQALWDGVGRFDDVCKKLNFIAYPNQVKISTPIVPFKGAPGWKEWHFNDGKSDAGRLYWKQGTKCVVVLISSKGRQKARQDEQWLKKN